MPSHLAQQPALAGQVRSVGGVVAGLVGELGLDVDELDAVQVGLLAHDVVHHLRVIVGIAAAQDGQADPVERNALALEGLDQAIDAAAVLLAPFVRFDGDAAAGGRDADGDAVAVADHDHADMHGLAAGRLLDAQLVLEVVAGEAAERAMPALQLQARVAGQRFVQARQQALGERIAIGLQLVDVAGGERIDVAGAAPLPGRPPAARRRRTTPRAARARARTTASAEPGARICLTAASRPMPVVPVQAACVRCDSTVEFRTVYARRMPLRQINDELDCRQHAAVSRPSQQRCKINLLGQRIGAQPLQQVEARDGRPRPD